MARRRSVRVVVGLLWLVVLVVVLGDRASQKPSVVVVGRLIASIPPLTRLNPPPSSRPSPWTGLLSNERNFELKAKGPRRVRWGRALAAAGLAAMVQLMVRPWIPLCGGDGVVLTATGSAVGGRWVVWLTCAVCASLHL